MLHLKDRRIWCVCTLVCCWSTNIFLLVASSSSDAFTLGNPTRHNSKQTSNTALPQFVSLDSMDVFEEVKELEDGLYQAQEDLIWRDMAGHYETAGETVSFNVQKATLSDVDKLLVWYGNEKNVRQYSRQELHSLVLERKVHIVVDVDSGELLMSFIFYELSKVEKIQMLTQDAGLTDPIIKKYPQISFYQGGLKMAPSISTNGGYLSNSKRMCMGIAIYSEIVRLYIRAHPDNSLLVCGASSLESMTTLHLLPTLNEMVCKAKDLQVTSQVLQECRKPGSNQLGIFTASVIEKKSDSSKIDLCPTTPSHDDFLKFASQLGAKTSWVESTVQITGQERPGFWDILPNTPEQLEKIVKRAVAANIVLDKVIGSGKTWGSATHSTSSPFRLNLSQLRSVPLLDLANGVIVVEPGVTQGEVSKMLRGSKWYLPVTGSCAHSSIVGNTLDSGRDSIGVRVRRVTGIEAIGWDGKKTKTGVLASRWHGHGFSGNDNASSFLFGQRGIVTKLALPLRPIPKYVGVSIHSLLGEEGLSIASELHNSNDATWWQHRADSDGSGNKKVVVALQAEGGSREEIERKLQLFEKKLGPCQNACCSTSDLEDVSITGEAKMSELFIREALKYFSGVPSCATHKHVLGSASCDETPADGVGFRASAFACPSNTAILALLRNEILAAASETEGINVTITATPMDSTEKRGSVYFLVWATFDRDNAGLEEPFFRSVQRIMANAKCPSFRYKAES